MHIYNFFGWTTNPFYYMNMHFWFLIYNQYLHLTFLDKSSSCLLLMLACIWSVKNGDCSRKNPTSTFNKNMFSFINIFFKVYGSQKASSGQHQPQQKVDFLNINNQELICKQWRAEGGGSEELVNRGAVGVLLCPLPLNSFFLSI